MIARTLTPLWHHPLMWAPVFWLPGEAGGYRVYGPALSPGAIDWATPAAHVTPGADEVDLAGLGLAADTDYYLGVRATSSAGVEEGGTAAVCRVRISGGALVGPPPNKPTWAAAEPAAGGRVTVRVTYSAVGAAGEATGIQVARVVGGTPNWGALLTTITVAGTGAFTATPSDVFADGEDVQLALRAVTAAGAVSDAITTRAVSADATAPAAARRLSGSQHDG